MAGEVHAYGRPEVEFSMIRNEFVRNKEVTPTAFRVAVYVQGHAAQFRLTQRSIASALGINETTVRSAFKELEKLRYLVRVPQRDERGHRAADDLHVSQLPFTDQQVRELLGVQPGEFPAWESQPGNSQGWDSQHGESHAPKEDHSDKKIKTQEDQDTPSPSVDSGLFAAPASAPQSEAVNRVLDEEFERWYADYPRKTGKGQALKAWRAARRAGAREQDLIDGLRRATAAWKRAGTEKRYIKHPATWLNGKCWLDEPDDIAPASGYVYHDSRWDAERTAPRDENGHTEEDRWLMERYGATVSYD